MKENFCIEVKEEVLNETYDPVVNLLNLKGFYVWKLMMKISLAKLQLFLNKIFPVNNIKWGLIIKFQILNIFMT